MKEKVALTCHDEKGYRRGASTYDKGGKVMSYHEVGNGG